VSASREQRQRGKTRGCDARRYRFEAKGAVRFIRQGLAMDDGQQAAGISASIVLF
jgi:hypothetical protein